MRAGSFLFGCGSRRFRGSGRERVRSGIGPCEVLWRDFCRAGCTRSAEVLHTDGGDVVTRIHFPRPCAHCGELFDPKGAGRGRTPQRFCSQRCAADYKAQKVRAAWPSPEDMRRLYVDEELTDVEIGKRYGRPDHWSAKIRREYGIPSRIGRPKVKNLEPRLHPSGYVYVGNDKQHRLVMEQKIGRKLVPGEVVHHIDGDRANNDPGNLVLYPSNSEHLWDERGRHAKKSRAKRRDWTQAREKVDAEGRCRVCGRSNVKIDAAHIIPRSQVAPGPGEHPDNIVPLCHERCHSAYDGGKLDLLPYLTLGEQGYAVSICPGGLLRTLERVTNTSWSERQAA
jgi:hypothetical protein